MSDALEGFHVANLVEFVVGEFLATEEAAEKLGEFFGFGRVLSFTRTVRIEADAWLMEQPCPWKATDSTFSSASRLRPMITSSPQKGLKPREETWGLGFRRGFWGCGSGRG